MKSARIRKSWAARTWGHAVVLTALATLLLAFGPISPGSASASAAPHRTLDSGFAPYAPTPSLVPTGHPTASAAGPTPPCATVNQANYPEVNAHQRALKESCAYAAARASVSAPGWVSEAGGPPSFYLYDFVMTYDSADQYVLLFGDPILPSASAPPQTWTYHAGNWSEVSTNGRNPSSCVSSAVSDDPADGYVVYLAGTSLANGSACPSAGETWTYHAGAWAEFSPAQSPPARSSASFTNDSGDGYLLLFGGLSPNGTVLGDTWGFSAGSWTALSPSTSPSARSSAGLTYDSADGYVLLFGGAGANATFYSMYNDSWKFSGGNWTDLNLTNGPPQPQPDGLAYGPAAGYALYTQICRNYSGNYGNQGPSEMTYEFAGGAWSQVNGSCSYSGSVAPAQRLGEGLTFDPSDAYFVLFGGGGPWTQSPELHDTWTWRAGTWTNRTPLIPGSGLPQYGAAVTYDSSEQAVLLFGGITNGYPTNGTWERVGHNWTQLHPTLSPAARSYASLAYDASDGYAVLFGGANGSTYYGDTWEFLAGQWTLLTPSTSPSPRGSPSMVDDAADNYLVLFGGGSYPDTWTFHAGVWSNITSTSGAPSTVGYLQNPLAYDATDGEIVAFGPVVGTSISNETWTFSGGQWTNLTGAISVAPGPRQEAAVAGMGPTGGVVLFSGYCWTPSDCGGSGLPADTWQFRNGNWTYLPGTVGPAGRASALFVFDPVEGDGVLYGGYGAGTGSGLFTDTWLLVPGAGQSPFLTSFHVNPSTVDDGATANFSSAVYGGTQPLSYSYGGLPSGCVSANASTLSCTPANGTSGSFRVSVQVTDAKGNVTGGATTLIVVPPPSVGTFTASPGNVSVGSRTIFRTTVAGGIPPFLYSYTNLPTGCLTQTVPALPCTPQGVGSFVVTVHVSDADHESANATATVVVGNLSVGHLTVSAFAADPPQLVLGNGTYLNVTANSTAGPITYLYSGLPTGCASANQSSLDCVSTATGTFSVRATISDVGGDTASVSANVTIYPVGSPWLPHIVEFGATPSSIRLGASVVLYVVAEGGNGTLTYAYSGLPPGCTSANVVTLACQPTSVGSFLITIEVTDTSGHLVEVHVALVVLAAAVPAPPGGATKVGHAGGVLPEWLEIGLVGLAAASLVALTWVLVRSRTPPVR